MRRIVSNMILTGLLLSLGLWLVSYTVLGWANGRTIISLSAGAIRYVEFTTLAAGPEKWWWSGFEGFGTRFVPSVGRNPSGMVFFVLPMWMPTVLFAMAFWICRRFVYWRRRRRKRFGHCLSCGYNLEGNVTGVCPECGEAR